MSEQKIACVILAAGKGSRMKSKLPKVMHRLAGQPMIEHVLRTADSLEPTQVVVVAGPGMPEVEKIAAAHGAKVAIQQEQKGTGHAVLCAKSSLQGFNGIVLVLYGDTPLLTAATLKRLMTPLNEGKADVAVLGFHVPHPAGYGRLVLGAGDSLKRIVEDRDASIREKQIMVCNSGVMAARADALYSLLSELVPNSHSGEFYLTDVVGLAHKHGRHCVMIPGEGAEVQGINTRDQLGGLEIQLQQQLRKRAVENGAMLLAPDTVYLAADTVIGEDCVIHPFVVFGAGVTLGNGIEIKSFSHLEQATVGDNAVIGPYARLRPGTELAEGVHIGNFVEIKKSQVAKGAKINHLSYVGDSEIGEGVNIGAGTITCNYDGTEKHKTVIKAGAFIGSNTSLVAPVEVGEGAIVGAGSVITENVPADALALERSEQTMKPDRAKILRAKK